MGVLAPLYLGGLAALSLPLIFHLIRRTPRGRQVFSSLMFLAPSPPRLTRRSRLDQIFLLLLRLAALGLLAFAFARPFLREAATLALENLPQRRVAVLVDTSASMRRADLWQQALRQVEKELAGLAPQDEVALFTFNDRLDAAVDFQSGQGTSPATRTELVRQSLKSLKPTWRATDLGDALTNVASQLDATSDSRQLVAEPQIIVISDFQRGARIEALQAYEWPKRVHVVARPLAPKRKANAYAQLLVGEDDAPATELRVRVANSSDSTEDQFFVSWGKDGLKKASDGETAVYVPPGQSRVVRLPRPEGSLDSDRIVLRGDDHDFDNTFYVVPPHKQEVKLLYAGSDAADDVRGAQHYLRLATAEDSLRQVELQPLEDAARLAADPPPQIVVVTGAVSTAVQEAVKGYAQLGGTLLLAPSNREAASIVPVFVDDLELRAEEPMPPEYLLLGEIDFTHPLFAPFANPRYSDFTKIHFWKHRPLTLKSTATTRAIARFDNGEPAILERAVGKGRVFAFTSGWQPDDSQLALSSKFVPLIAALLDQACGPGQTLASMTVGNAVAIPMQQRGGALVVHTPGGRDVRLAADSASFTDTDEPGTYSIGSGRDEVRFAVNLPASESNTAPLELEQLEQLGVKFGTALTASERLDRVRQERDTELESRQKIWRWLVVGALGTLILETWWAGRASRQTATSLETIS